MKPAMLIDSHVNLHHHAFAEDREAVIARARDAGVARMLTICDRIENFGDVIAIAEKHDDIYASVGAHPHYAKDHLDLTAERLIELGRHEKVVGVGETGLDQHYKFSPFEDQVAAFRAHAKAAHGVTPLIRTKPNDLARAGVERVGRVVGVRDGRPVLADGRVIDPANVIWCTGYHAGFSWIDLPVFEADSGPRHDRGVVRGERGLYFVGLHWLYAMSSPMVHGVGRDADYVAGVVAERVKSATPPLAHAPLHRRAHAAA